MPTDAHIQAQVIKALIHKLSSLGYKPLPQQVWADRMQFVSAKGLPLEVVLLSLNLDHSRSVSLNQRDFDYTLRPDLWIFLVLTMSDMQAMLYLIPSTVFSTPNDIFLTHQQPPALHHFSTWEIKIFTRAIPTLSRYALEAATELDRP